jgi:EAL domain-containing protein (putative c-di-GMP-specific phosphodiesterase class I)
MVRCRSPDRCRRAVGARPLIAEGVETEEQLACLRERDCHKVQGYLFGRPVPAEELALWLAQRGRAAV